MKDALSAHLIKELTLDHVIEEKAEYAVDDVVRTANIVIAPGENVSVLPHKIMKEFNKGIETSLYTNVSMFRPGDRIQPTQFRLGTLNQVPELLMDTGHRIGRKLSAVFSPYIQSENLGDFDFFAKFYGAAGHYVVNVPPGQFAKAFSGNDPLILGEGTHVIHDPGFQFDPAHAFVKQDDFHIEHGILHIIRVPEGMYGKITKDNIPMLLAPSKIPYVFKTRVFKYEPPVDQRIDYINHSNIIHILRVQAGFLTKVWINNEPVLLETRDDPYVYRSPQLVVEMNGHSHLWDATLNQIEHGKLKRLIPPAKQVFVINNKGVLEIVDRAVMITDADTKVVTTLPTSIQTHIFPSRKSNQAQKIGDQELEGHVTFMTKDSLRMGVKIMVAYQLTDPAEVIKQLLPDEINRHIESLATTEMGKMIQTKTSQELMASYNSNLANKSGEEEKSYAPQVDPDSERISLADAVRFKLAEDLSHIGITLHRLNIESFVPVDKAILNEIAKLAVSTAAAATKMATIKQDMIIESQEAERKAKVSDIETAQKNKNQIANAQAELDAARKSAEAKTVGADGDASASERLAEAEAKNIRIVGDAKAAALQAEADVYDRNPGMLELKKVEAISKGLRDARLSIFSPDMGTVVSSVFSSVLGVKGLDQSGASEEKQEIRQLGK